MKYYLFAMALTLNAMRRVLNRKDIIEWTRISHRSLIFKDYFGKYFHKITKALRKSSFEPLHLSRVISYLKFILRRL